MKKLLLYITAIFTSLHISAQQKETFPISEIALTEKIIALDAAAFNYYNTCDLEKFVTYFSSDLEFYHDKGGYTVGTEKFIDNTRKYICNNPEGKVLRKPVTASLKVYPLYSYGAILEGEHQFYLLANDKEKLTGKAKFTHLWLLKDGVWKMSRVLSYDHKAAE